jgi:hypothetical protein
VQRSAQATRGKKDKRKAQPLLGNNKAAKGIQALGEIVLAHL